VQAIEDVVEDFDQRDFAYVAPFGGTQQRSDMHIELFFGYTGRDSAHEKSPLARFFLHDALSTLLNQIV
jgi:hypothetical protein